MRDYCWRSRASLYTCLRLSFGSPTKDWLGITIIKGFPEFTQFSHPKLLREGPKIQSSALPLSYLGIGTFVTLSLLFKRKSYSCLPKSLRKILLPPRTIVFINNLGPDAF